MTAPRSCLVGGALWLGACATGALPGAGGETSFGVANYERPPGTPIGTGAGGGELPAPPAPLDNRDLAIPQYAPPVAAPATPVPCSGCVELNAYVNDINQRDEFAFRAAGLPLTRVVWTILVNFNSDQLAVQPFVDDVYGKYTNLHVNTFPLATPVEVVQDVERNAQTIGLVIGSSGAWTGDQIMSVFVDSVRIEGPDPFEKAFATGPEGLEPRTARRQPKLVWHASEKEPDRRRLERASEHN
jgi:hypothetical protein